MVLQQRVYATGNPAPSTRTVNSASSRGGGEREPWVGRSQKDFLEQHILRRREAEVKRLSFWSETSQYFDKVAKNAERYNGLASEATRRQSLEAANKEEAERKKQANLSSRREKLRALLERENKGYQEELASLPSGQQPITDLRVEREKLRREREERSKAEGELKMLQHWRINNPGARRDQRERQGVLASKLLQKQMKEKQEMDEEKKKEEEEHHRRAMEEEARKEREAQIEEEKRQEKVRKWKADLESQMEELREREREAETFRRMRVEQEELQRRVEECEEERKRVEKKREQRQLETFQRRQHKLKLRQKTKVIQEELEEDRRRLQEMEELTKLQDEVLQEKRDKAMQEVIWMRGVVEEQASEERRRENEAETMYAEEAERMWEKQEEVWRREATARKRLMQEVVAGWKHQNEERLATAQAAEDDMIKQKQKLEHEVQELHSHIQEAERKEREKQESLVKGLDQAVKEREVQGRRNYAAEQEAAVQSRREEIRQENLLAKRLAGWGIGEDSNPADFRRRKVRWFY